MSVNVVEQGFQGIIEHLQADAYHASSALGSSGIKKMGQSASHFLHYTTAAEDISSTKRDSFSIGTCAHSLCVENNPSAYLVGPEVSTKAVKAWKEFVDANPDKIVVSPKEHKQLFGMYGKFQAHPEVCRLVQNTFREKSFFHTDHEHGIWLKARPDIISKDHTVIIDYKTTARPATQHSFTNTMAQLQYDVSAAHYAAITEQTTGVKVKEVFWIVQETEAPYEIMVYRATPALLRGAEMVRQNLLSKIRIALQTNNFPGYPTDVLDIDLPQWKISELADSLGDIA